MFKSQLLCQLSYAPTLFHLIIYHDLTATQLDFWVVVQRDCTTSDFCLVTVYLLS